MAIAELALIKTVMNNPTHPYWDQYLQLRSLKDSFKSNHGKASLRQLARDANFDSLEMFKLSLLINCPGVRFRFIERLFFCVLREDYAYSVFPPEVLLIIAALTPLVELGAGNGYLAWLLHQMNADIIAFDAFPVEEGRNWFFHTRYGLPAKGALSWKEIQKGDAPNLVAFPDRTLLLCWPPKNSMACDALSYFTGDRLVLVLEKSCCANKEFFNELKNSWTLEYSNPTGSWSDCHRETLEIYSRNKANQKAGS